MIAAHAAVGTLAGLLAATLGALSGHSVPMVAALYFIAGWGGMALLLLWAALAGRAEPVET
jgi:hypothetical protein